MTDTTPPGRPIFILGSLPRSGTNFLSDLLVIHPDCGTPRLHEDYLLAQAQHLDRYASALTSHWRPEWGLGQAEVYVALGAGLLSLIGQGARCPRLMTKTPSVRNLPLVFKLFPQAQVLLLVRDGRAVAESGVRTLKGWTYEKAAQWWAVAARTVFEFDSAQPAGAGRHLVVRYEDLHLDTAAQLRRILSFLGLEESRYDFGQAAALPVRGSSVDHGAQAGVHWETIARPADFDPLQRWKHWPLSRHERFRWVAGTYMRQFGYELEAPARPKLLWRLWNQQMDRQWLREANKGQERP